MHHDSSGTSFLLRDGIVVCGVATWFARWLLPAESATSGDTLWIVAIWSLLWFIHWYRQFREGNPPSRLSLWEIGMWLIVVSQCAAAGALLMEGGQRRAAINSCWEWIGVGISTSLMLSWLKSRRDRRHFFSIILTFFTVLAGLGIWQHFIWYPATASEYKTLLDEYDELRSGTTGDRSHRIHRLEQIERQLSQEGIPSERQARMIFEQRLFASTEPIGFFALANSFSGLLAVGTVMGILGWYWHKRAQTTTDDKSHSPRSLVFISTSLAIISYCLLLTKSRTAWGGTTVSLIIGLFVATRSFRLSWSGGMKIVVVVIVAIMIIGGIMTMTGGLDRQVLSEAPKSLRYRLEFWTGTWQVIREHPWLGVGPGNFRQHYLQHKLVESSEEIADPHQMLLDLWVHGGIVSLLGVGLMLWTAGRSLLANRLTNVPGTPSLSSRDADDPSRAAWIWGAVGCFLLVLGMQIVTGEMLDVRILICGVGFACLLPFGLKVFPSLLSSEGIWGMAGLTMFVHLQGAGGISMPALTQLLFLLPALSFASGPDHISSVEQSDQGSASQRSALTLSKVALAVIIFAGLMITAFQPVRNCRRFLAEGDYVLYSGNSPQIAAAYYRQAAEADPWNPEPYHRLANLSWTLWESRSGENDPDFEQGIEAQSQANERDPHNHRGYRILGEWHMKRNRRSSSPVDAQAAVVAYSRAVEFYPTHALLQWELATACQAAGLVADARRAAERALEIDDINRRYNHLDKFLPAEQIKELRQLLGSAMKP
ncbi:MAG: O-antigen ligase family protein [Planctomycetaceae bacterium]